jgi:murein L,D-transpeptidase YcbB/YkuD
VPPASYQPTLTDDQAATEIAISLAILKYARAARGGLVEPSALSKIYDQSPTVRPPETVLTEISTASAPATYLADLHPKHEQFTRLRQAQLKAQTEADKERLKVNMDRWRWMPETLGETYVWLNIPEFMLHVVKDGKAAESEKIVVGSPNSPTPVLSADMTEIVFNPERVVPLSVIRRDVLPKLRESGGLFGGGATAILEQYQLTANNRGRAIDPSKIDWDTVDLSKLTFVQAPGPTNILGKVQFLYPNDRDIYLHDTIIRSQLTRAVRAEGQSEPRVANPEKLAGVLLAESNGWSTAKAGQAAAGGKRTAVKLDKPIPVHMTYFTVLVDDQGEVKTFGDVYKLDEIEEPDDAAAVSPPVAGSAPIPARNPGNGSLAASAPKGQVFRLPVVFELAAGGQRMRPHGQIDHQATEQESSGNGRCAPIAGRDPHRDEYDADDHAKRGHEPGNFELARLLALAPFQHEQRAVHHRENAEQQQDGGGGEFGDRARQRQRHENEE